MECVIGCGIIWSRCVKIDYVCECGDDDKGVLLFYDDILRL